MVMAPVEDVARIEDADVKLACKPGFCRMQRHCPIMATWDDHDYGVNDAGNEFELREASQQAFLDLWGLGPTGPIRDQEGVYNARVFEQDGRTVQIIMLDTR